MTPREAQVTWIKIQMAWEQAMVPIQIERERAIAELRRQCPHELYQSRCMYCGWRPQEASEHTELEAP